jgi:hypothetical protein
LESTTPSHAVVGDIVGDWVYLHVGRHACSRAVDASGNCRRAKEHGLAYDPSLVAVEDIGIVLGTTSKHLVHPVDADEARNGSNTVRLVGDWDPDAGGRIVRRPVLAVDHVGVDPERRAKGNVSGRQPADVLEVMEGHDARIGDRDIGATVLAVVRRAD